MCHCNTQHPVELPLACDAILLLKHLSNMIELIAGSNCNPIIYPECTYHPVVFAPCANVEDCMIAGALYIA
jgi:hypothetical protein